MENQPYLSVIVPARNEEKRISKTLLAMDQYLQKQDFDYEIIIFSNGSTDKTGEIVTNFQRTIKNLKLVEREKSLGKGWAVREAILTVARGQIRLFMDADNATTLDHFDRMRHYFDSGAQVVIGSRESRDAKGARQAVSQPWHKRQLGNLGNLLIQLFAVWGVWDTQCGFKAFSAKAAQDIFSHCRINGWGFDIEVLALARRLGYKIEIIPVYWINDASSQVNFKAYLSTFRELFRIWWRLVTDAYKIRKK